MHEGGAAQDVALFLRTAIINGIEHSVDAEVLDTTAKGKEERLFIFDGNGIHQG